MRWNHYIDDIMLTSDSLSDLKGGVAGLLQHLQEKGWTVNCIKDQGLDLSVKFLGVVWLGKTKVVPEAVTDKVQAFPTPINCGSITRVSGSFGLLEIVYPALGTNSEALILSDTKGHQVGLV